MSASGLEPLTPTAAIEWYLDHRQDETRTATHDTLRSGLSVFQRWADEVGLTNLNELSGRQLVAYKTWRKSEADNKRISLNGTLSVLRRFLRFCERIEAVEEGLADRVPVPNVPPDEEVKYDVPPDEAVETLREYFRRFEYASRQQAELELVAEVGIRLGAVRAIDMGDLALEENAIQLRHRPEGPDEYGTPLKNGTDGERRVNISPPLSTLLENFIDHHREDVIDKFDRHPLVTTVNGRIARTTLRRDFYKFTRPCEYGDNCPHDRAVDACEATDNLEAASCPSSFTTHPLRKWSIMNQLQAGMPKELLSDRVDVSVPVLDKHYDQRSEERKAAQRQRALEANIATYEDIEPERD